MDRWTGQLNDTKLVRWKRQLMDILQTLNYLVICHIHQLLSFFYLLSSSSYICMGYANDACTDMYSVITCYMLCNRLVIYHIDIIFAVPKFSVQRSVYFRGYSLSPSVFSSVLLCFYQFICQYSYPDSYWYSCQYFLCLGMLFLCP